MDDLDLEKLKQELDDVSGGSVYNVDDILREAGAPESIAKEEDLSGLMKRFGIEVPAEEQKTAPITPEKQTKTQVFEPESVPQEPVYTAPAEPVLAVPQDSYDAVCEAADQTQNLVEDQQELSGDTQQEMDILEEQDNVFAQLFAQLGQIEEEADDEQQTKPMTQFVDPRIHNAEQDEDEPDLMDRLFENMPKAQDTDDLIEPEHTVHWEVPEDFSADLVEPEPQEQVESEEEVILPIEDETTKKSFFAKLFGDEEDDDEDETDDEEEETEPSEEESESEPEQAQSEEEVILPIEDENPKKSFFAKLFGDEEDDDEDESDDEEEETEPSAEEPASEPEQAQSEDEVILPIEDETTKKSFFAKLFGDEEDDDEDETDDEEEETEPSEEESESEPKQAQSEEEVILPIEDETPKKGFFAKLFGDEEDDDEDETDDEEEETEPSAEELASEPEQAQSEEEVILPIEDETTKKSFFAKLFGDEDDDDEDESDDEEEETEPSEEEPASEPKQAQSEEEVILPIEDETPKKGFFAKLFGDEEDDDEDESDDEEEETEPSEEQSASEPEQAQGEEEVILPIEDETPKKGFFAKLFGDEEDDDEDESDDEEEETEPSEEQSENETELFDEIPTAEPEQPARMMAEEQPILSQAELDAFLKDVDDEPDAPRLSFEDILRGNGLTVPEPEIELQTDEPEAKESEVEQPMIEPNPEIEQSNTELETEPEIELHTEEPERPEEEPEIDLEDFPKSETTVYFDIPVKESAPQTHHAEVFDFEESEQDGPENEQPAAKPEIEQQTAEPEIESSTAEPEKEKEPPVITLPEEDPEWLGVPLTELSHIAPDLDILRWEGPVMAREVSLQRELAAHRMQKDEPAEPADTADTVCAENPQETIQPADAAEQLHAVLEKEEKPVFNDRSTDEAHTELVGREIKTEAKADPKQTAHTEKVREEKKNPHRKKDFVVWPQEQAPNDVNQASKEMKTQARRQATRSIAVGILTLIAIYLSCAADFSLPLPAALDYVENPSHVLIALIVLTLAAMACAYDVIKEGVLAAIYCSPNFSTLVTLALVFNLIHCVERLIWEGEEMPYTCVILVALFAQLRMHIAQSASRHYTYKVSGGTQQPMGIFKRTGDRGDCLIKIPMHSTDSFVHRIVITEDIRKAEVIGSMLLMMIAVVISVIVCVATGDLGRLIYVLSATFTGAAQIALLCAIPMGQNHAARHMMKDGCAADGLRGARHIASANKIALSDEDLFPIGSVELEDMDLCSSLSDTTALAYAAALAGESSLGYMLQTELRARYGKPLPAHEVLQYTDGGIGGHVGGLKILLGSSKFLMERGIAVGALADRMLGLAVEGELAAVFTISYRVSPALFNAVQMLAENNMKIVLHSRNYQVTPDMVEHLYDLERGSVCKSGLEFDRDLRRARRQDGDVLCGIQIRDGIVPFGSCVATAKAQARISVLCAVIGAAASVLCILLMAYMCYVFIPADARPIRMLLYAILWFIPIFFMENGIGRE